MNAYLDKYRNCQAQTASPEQILIMLHDGAIRFTNQAQQAMLEGNQKVQAEKISRAIAIVTEFSNTLDREVGGEIAENLDALYHFMIRELTQANLKKDPEKIGTVQGLLSDLRETWMQAIELRNQTTQVKAPEPVRASGGAVG